MRKLKLSPLVVAFATVCTALTQQAVAADTSINNLFNLEQNCATGEYGVDQFSKMFTCGSVHGAIKTLYYSTNNAYFSGFNQDTTSAGGYIKYETAPFYGFQLGASYDLQRRLDDEKGNNEVGELKEDRDGLAEAYVTWKNDDVRLTVGNQRLNLPFVGDYADWRILEAVYQAADFQWGNQSDFLRLTKINKFKSFANDEFFKTTRQNSTIETDGMWAVGLGKSYAVDADTKLKGQLWFERYEDYTDLLYAEGSVAFPNAQFAPEISVQYLMGKEQGDAIVGNVDSQVFGVQSNLKLTPKFNWKVAYDYIKPEEDAYRNGALVTPYSNNTSSSVIFAQPFFTSTQDLGAGHALMTSFDGKLNDNTILGARYSFMDLKESADADSRNQSEYLLFGIYNFDGKLKGLSLSDFAGVQVSPRYDDPFWQNRLALTYKF